MLSTKNTFFMSRAFLHVRVWIERNEILVLIMLGILSAELVMLHRLSRQMIFSSRRRVEVDIQTNKWVQLGKVCNVTW